MMDIEKLIEQLNDFNENHIAVLCGSGQCACGYLCDKDDCIVVRAATALFTLQAENERLWAELYSLRPGFQNQKALIKQLRAELEQVKQERDAAVDCIYQIEDDLNRGSDNDWAREHIAEWESHKED